MFFTGRDPMRDRDKGTVRHPGMSKQGQRARNRLGKGYTGAETETERTQEGKGRGLTALGAGRVC